MKRSVFTTGTWLVMIGAALLVTAGLLNFAQRARRETPAWDGVRWVDTTDGIIAETVEPNSAAARAWILPGDKLHAISLDGITRDQIGQAKDVQIYLDQAGVGGRLHYLIERPSYPQESRAYFADLDNLDATHKWSARVVYINLIGVVYLFVGFFVLFRQGGRAPFVLHFATLCLAAFVFHFFTPTGAYRDLDLAVAFLDSAAFILFAPLFLHFCALYPSRQQLFNERRWRAVLIYVPALILLSVATAVFLRDVLTPVLPFLRRVPAFSDSFISLLYRLMFLHFAASVVVSAGLLIRTALTTNSTVVRQQLKWVIWGSLLAITPFSLLYGVGYLFGAQGDPLLIDIAVVPLILIPLAFGYSVLRYRLMDVELVVRRVFVYALTTLAIALLIGSVVYLAGLYALGGDASFTSGEITLRVVVAIVAMAAIVMAAAPVKNFLQERTDRLFYGERYDMRNSLLDFGRTLSATTALDPLLDSLISRLQEVMNVERVAIFIESHDRSGYRVARAAGLSSDMIVPPDFREMIRVRSAESGVVRTDDLDLVPETTGFVKRALHYYVPCVVRGRMVAVIGLGRSADGALLSSEDVEILRTVSGYVAVAIENSLLYQEQQERASELKLLKEFNESIIESINVGLLAVDLDGKVTRLNSALEQILDLSRQEAVGKYVEDLFSEDFADTLRQVLGEDRWRLKDIRNIYKIHTATLAGQTLVLNIAIAPLQDSQEEQPGALVVVEDVTSKVTLEEQLQQREKLSSIGLLAAGVAHEVNTPLTGVSSYTQMLLGMLPDNDPKHALLQKVRTQAERATNIVNNLLNFSRTGSATEFSEIDIHRVLDDTIQLLEPQLRRNQIDIQRNYDLDAPKVIGNSGKLQQVFTNLLLNARDSIPDGGRITIGTLANDDDDVLVVEVSDTGIGIAPENVAKIYDPFYTTKGVGRGTGLGLAVSYGIVQEHSGHISVDSLPGRGTTFRITLPTVETRARLQAVGD